MVSNWLLSNHPKLVWGRKMGGGGRRKWRIKVCSIYQPTSQGAANHQRPGVNEAASALGHGGWGGGGGVNCHPYQRAYGPHIPAHIRPGPLVRDKWGGSN